MRGNELDFGASKTRTLHTALKSLKISDFQRNVQCKSGSKKKGRKDGNHPLKSELTENAETSLENNIFTVQGINGLMGKLVKRSE